MRTANNEDKLPASLAKYLEPADEEEDVPEESEE
jgi:hypothetical protein